MLDKPHAVGDIVTFSDPKKNTERGAIARFGAKWVIMQLEHPTTIYQLLIAPESADGVDRWDNCRWVDISQVDAG
jgi:hypothetical protein